MCNGVSDGTEGEAEQHANMTFADPAEARDIIDGYLSGFEFDLQEGVGTTNLDEQVRAQARFDAAQLVSNLSNDEIENGDLKNYIDGVKRVADNDGSVRGQEMMEVLEEMYEEIYGERYR